MRHSRPRGNGQGGRVEVVTDGCPLRGGRRSRAGARAARRTSGATAPAPAARWTSTKRATGSAPPPRKHRQRRQVMRPGAGAGITVGGVFRQFGFTSTAW